MTGTRNLIEELRSITECYIQCFAKTQESWSAPIAEGKASPGKIVAHLMFWDRYLLGTTLPAVTTGEDVVFPTFDGFNRKAYDYAESGIGKDALLQEAIDVRNRLCDMLAGWPEEELTKPITIHGKGVNAQTGESYTVTYLLQEFLEHDAHHKVQLQDRS